VEPTGEQAYQRRIAELEAEVAELKAQVAGLSELVAKLPKNPSNSSKPPSSEIVKPSKPKVNARKSAGRLVVKRVTRNTNGNPLRSRTSVMRGSTTWTVAQTAGVG